MKSPRRTAALIALGALVVALFAIVAVAQGIGDPSPSGEEIAVVEDAEDGNSVAVTQEQLDAELEVVATRQGLEGVPAEDDPQFETIRDAAFGDLLLVVWVRGEAEDRGIEVTEQEVDDELGQIKEQQFNGNEQRFQRFLEESGFTEESARERLELQLLSNAIQEDVIPAEPAVDEAQIEEYFEANPEQFQQPESRNVRVIQTANEEDAQEALSRLEEDDSQRSWRRVARDLSTDPATQDVGGLRQGVIEGQNEQALDEQIFSAPEGELVGPFQGEAGHYVISVEQITPAQSITLEEARDQIRQTIAGQESQQVAQDFQTEFLEKWRSRTFCAEGYRIDRCANAEPPPPACPEEAAEAQGCPAPVPSIRPIDPGTASRFGQAPGRPQGPLTPEPAQPEIPEGLEGLPPDLQQVPQQQPGQGAPPPQP
ncbi:MAG TPA: peptidyl-prolyl cis-trans isomerase [Solirubrobacterales bacterium]|nr:peptidyl-prolyl cis-trans isomerase [Solirubrobacterales bacterium]